MRKHEPLTGYRHICPVCGKEFWGSSDWKFTKIQRGPSRAKIYYCSWKCIRKTEEETHGNDQ